MRLDIIGNPLCCGLKLCIRAHHLALVNQST